MAKKLRDYTDKEPQFRFYMEQHANQTYDFVKSKLDEYQTVQHTQMKMSKALQLMDLFVDPSDPDVSSANSIHAYQTAERVRAEHPDDEEMQICGLIHDLGKVLFSFGEPAWAVVGDTFVVGCEFPKSIVYYEDTMHENPDYYHPIYSSKYGVYAPNCGIENVLLSFGHDEYLYRVLQSNSNHLLSKRYQQIIRFHSCYPWHTGNAYSHLEQSSDSDLKQLVLEFNKYDLYSKQDTEFVLTREIRHYYKALLEKYFPEPLNW